MKYRVTVPPTRDVGSYTTVVGSGGHYGSESVAARALWDYNSCRAHDGLPPLRRMPAGTVYHPIRMWVVQQYTGKQYGWEDVTAEDTIPEARLRAREYRENQPEYPVRIRSKPAA